MKKIIPAVLTNDFDDLAAKFNKLKNLTDWVQVDILDGRFVDNTSIGLNDLKKAAPDFKIEADLMVLQPENYLAPAQRAKIGRFVFHLEASDHPGRVLDLMEPYPFEKGISLNPGTPLSAVRPYLDRVDLVFLFGVSPGFQNQKFIPATLRKIKELKNLAPAKKIEVDGGIKLDNIGKVARAGADLLVVGSGLFESDNIKERYKKLEQAIAV